LPGTKNKLDMLFVKSFRPQKYKYKIVLQKKRKRLIQKGILNKAYLIAFHIHVLQISLDAFNMEEIRK